MSDMKCPFCGQELKHEKITGIYCCPTIFIDCPLGSGTGAFGTKELWQELIRTRKALNVAVEELTKIKVDAESVGIGFFMTAAIFALAKIKTALKQKD